MKNDEEEATFKQYKRYDNTKILHPLNPRYNDIVQGSESDFGISRMLDSMLEQDIQAIVRSFRSADEAREWLVNEVRNH